MCNTSQIFQSILPLGRATCMVALTILLAGCLQNMSFAYLQRRTELVNTALAYARSLGLKDEVAHDAMLLMDRTMSTSLQVFSPPRPHPYAIDVSGRSEDHLTWQ